jgi:hypothetical protein
MAWGPKGSLVISLCANYACPILSRFALHLILRHFDYSLTQEFHSIFLDKSILAAEPFHT